MFKYTLDNKRYHTLNYYLRNKFNSKVCKISLNAGFTCPNIDGTKGYGGCIYCSKSGSGEFGGNPSKSLVEQFNDVKEELSKRTFLTIELGLQTTKEETSILINRGHTLKEFDDMVKKLRDRNINVVVHIINGLPYENEDDMLNTVRHLNKLDIQGIKIHMLNIVKDTPLEVLYNKEKFHILTKDEYIDIVIKQLELLDEKIVIHRITADPDIKSLVEPKWLVKKFCVLNDIDKEMVRRDTYQGKYFNS